MAGLRLESHTLSCGSGHRFDVARQGYLNLMVGAKAHPGDTAAMIAAREEFLGGGHYAPINRALATLAAEHVPGARFVLDVGGGTGHYLAGVLDALPAADGVCLDTSVPALRRAARAHPRAAALGADAWRSLPFADAVTDLVLTVFAPRGAAEVARILRPGGVWLLVTPLPGHLEQVREPLGMLGVEERKSDRLANDTEGFTPLVEREVVVEVELTRADLRALVLMGPSAHHVEPGVLDARLTRLPDPQTVTVAVRLSAVTR